MSHGWAGLRQQSENTVSGREQQEEEEVEEEKAEYGTEQRVARVAGFGWGRHASLSLFRGQVGQVPFFRRGHGEAEKVVATVIFERS